MMKTSVTTTAAGWKVEHLLLLLLEQEQRRQMHLVGRKLPLLFVWLPAVWPNLWFVEK